MDVATFQASAVGGGEDAAAKETAESAEATAGVEGRTEGGANTDGEGKASAFDPDDLSWLEDWDEWWDSVQDELRAHRDRLWNGDGGGGADTQPPHDREPPEDRGERLRMIPYLKFQAGLYASFGKSLLTNPETRAMFARFAVSRSVAAARAANDARKAVMNDPHVRAAGRIAGESAKTAGRAALRADRAATVVGGVALGGAAFAGERAASIKPAERGKTDRIFE